MCWLNGSSIRLNGSSIRLNGSSIQPVKETTQQHLSPHETVLKRFRVARAPIMRTRPHRPMRKGTRASGSSLGIPDKLSLASSEQGYYVETTSSLSRASCWPSYTIHEHSNASSPFRDSVLSQTWSMAWRTTRHVSSSCLLRLVRLVITVSRRRCWELKVRKALPSERQQQR